MAVQLTISRAPDPRRIVVMGVGGGGGNALDSMIEAGLGGVEFVAANTDQQALAGSGAPLCLPLGETATRGLGAGARPDVGRLAAEESREQLASALQGAGMVFVAAGLGGGTGTGASPVVAAIAREYGALVVGVVTLPFDFEGSRRRAVAERGLEELRSVAHTVIVVPNDRLLALAGDEMSGCDAFRTADRVLHDAVRGVVDLIQVPGVINVDFADVRTILSYEGAAMIGLGVGSGAGAAAEAARGAISSALLEDGRITGARGILVNLSSSSILRLNQMHEAMRIVRKEAAEDAEIIFGWVVDEGLGDEVRVTVVATGCEVQRRVQTSPAVAPARVDSRVRVAPVQGWNPSSTDNYDLPPAVRHQQGKAERPREQVQEAFQFEGEQDLSEFDVPTFARLRVR
jgi:cell division protein FtsZ